MSGSRAGAVKVESLEVFMPAPEMDGELCVYLSELKGVWMGLVMQKTRLLFKLRSGTRDLNEQA